MDANGPSRNWKRLAKAAPWKARLFFQQAAAVNLFLTFFAPGGRAASFALWTTVNRLAVLPQLPREWVHLKTSSGTAGKPQMIAFTATQLAADARNIVAAMGLRPDWPNLGVVSLAHSYGFSNLVTPLLLHGIPLILLPSRLPEAVRQACSKFPNLTLPAVPTLWRVWHEADGILPSVKLAISAGAPMPAPLEAAIFERTGIKVHNFYGASECGGICYEPSTTPRADTQNVGVPMPNVAIETDSDGCLAVTSDAAGEGYWPVVSPALGRGRFQSGDLAEFVNGQVFIRGRRGDVINIAGRKVAPEAIEQAILRHPSVRDCVVFGLAGTRRRPRRNHRGMRLHLQRCDRGIASALHRKVAP